MKKDYIEKKEEYVLKETNNGKIMVRELQVSLLEIMDEINRICRKNNIDYALFAGSALGMVNYKGFIPWDDDMDIAIAKKDYLRFIDALKNDLSDDFVFHCYETDKRYNVFIPNIKIRKRNTYLKEVNYLLRNRCDDGDGIFIDVIWYGNMSENKFIDQFNRTKVRLLMPFVVLLENINLNPVFLKNLVVKIYNKYSDRNESSKFATQSIGICFDPIRRFFLKEDIFPFKDCEFEGRTYMTINNVEGYLIKNYGPNCLKKWNGKEFEETLPIEKRKAAHIVDINLKSNKPE